MTFTAIFTLLEIDKEDLEDGDYDSCYFIRLHNHPERGTCTMWVGITEPEELFVGRQYSATLSSEPLPSQVIPEFAFHRILSEVVTV